MTQQLSFTELLRVPTGEPTGGTATLNRSLLIFHTFFKCRILEKPSFSTFFQHIPLRELQDSNVVRVFSFGVLSGVANGQAGPHFCWKYLGTFTRICSESEALLFMASHCLSYSDMFIGGNSIAYSHISHSSLDSYISCFRPGK